MARDDSTGPLVAAAVTLAALLMSPRVRTTLRGAAVQGLAGVLAAGDGVMSFAQGVSRGVRDPNVSPPDGATRDARPATGGDAAQPQVLAGPVSKGRRRPRARAQSPDESSTAAPPETRDSGHTADE